jgi:hypothetical protein
MFEWWRTANAEKSRCPEDTPTEVWVCDEEDGDGDSPDDWDQPETPRPPSVSASLFLYQMLQLAKENTVARLDADCADAVGANDSAQAKRMLGSLRVDVRDLGRLTGEHVGSGEWRPTGGPVAQLEGSPWNGTPYGSIVFNTQVNWHNPRSQYMEVDGVGQFFDLVQTYGSGLGAAAMSEAQFIDSIILHELAHAFADRRDPHLKENREKIWQHCF